MNGVSAEPLLRIDISSSLSDEINDQTICAIPKKSKTLLTGVTVFLEGRNSRMLIPLRALFSGCLLGGVFSEPGDF